MHVMSSFTLRGVHYFETEGFFNLKMQNKKSSENSWSKKIAIDKLIRFPYYQNIMFLKFKIQKLYQP